MNASKDRKVICMQNTVAVHIQPTGCWWFKKKKKQLKQRGFHVVINKLNELLHHSRRKSTHREKKSSSNRGCKRCFLRANRFPQYRALHGVFLNLTTLKETTGSTRQQLTLASAQQGCEAAQGLLPFSFSKTRICTFLTRISKW